MSKTVKEVADELGVTPQAVRNYGKTLSQSLCKKVGKRFVISDEGVEQMHQHFQRKSQSADSKDFAKTLQSDNALTLQYESRIEEQAQTIKFLQAMLVEEKKEKQLPPPEKITFRDWWRNYRK